MVSHSLSFFASLSHPKGIVQIRLYEMFKQFLVRIILLLLHILSRLMLMLRLVLLLLLLLRCPVGVINFN